MPYPGGACTRTGVPLGGWVTPSPPARGTGRPLGRADDAFGSSMPGGVAAAVGDGRCGGDPSGSGAAMATARVWLGPRTAGLSAATADAAPTRAAGTGVAELAAAIVWTGTARGLATTGDTGEFGAAVAVTGGGLPDGAGNTPGMAAERGAGSGAEAPAWLSRGPCCRANCQPPRAATITTTAPSPATASHVSIDGPLRAAARATAAGAGCAASGAGRVVARVMAGCPWTADGGSVAGLDAAQPGAPAGAAAAKGGTVVDARKCG